MGFIYTKDGKLCCDICGNYPATKKPCKYGYCQPYALCKACREDTVKMTKLNDYHETVCKPASIEFDKVRKQEASMLDAGLFLRCAALSHKDKIPHSESIKVIFRNKEREEVSYFMSDDTYHAFPLGTPTTPNDYQSKGKIIKCLNNDIYQAA